MQVFTHDFDEEENKSSGICAGLQAEWFCERAQGDFVTSGGTDEVPARTTTCGGRTPRFLMGTEVKFHKEDVWRLKAFARAAALERWVNYNPVYIRREPVGGWLAESRATMTRLHQDDANYTNIYWCGLPQLGHSASICPSYSPHLTR